MACVVYFVSTPITPAARRIGRWIAARRRCGHRGTKTSGDHSKSSASSRRPGRATVRPLLTAGGRVCRRAAEEVEAIRHRRQQVIGQAGCSPASEWLWRAEPRLDGRRWLAEEVGAGRSGVVSRACSPLLGELYWLTRRGGTRASAAPRHHARCQRARRLNAVIASSRSHAVALNQQGCIPQLVVGAGARSRQWGGKIVVTRRSTWASPPRRARTTSLGRSPRIPVIGALARCFRQRLIDFMRN